VKRPLWDRTGLTLAAFSASFGAHVLGWHFLGAAKADVRPEIHTIVLFDALAVAPPVPQAPRPEEPPVPRTRERAVAPAPARASIRPAAQPAATPAIAAPAAPVDLSGVTLASEGSGTWSSLVGDGSDATGPLVSRGDEAKKAAPPEPTVALRNLSERPRAPALDALLRQNYPDAARQRGIGGSASVTARIEPDGVVRLVRLFSESEPGFGEACRRTLLGSRWSPPRTVEGRVVATEVRYTCRFQVMP
jgi:outer membrane biosynthesis protein TonB